MPALARATDGLASVTTLLKPSLEVIFHEYFKASPSASVVPFDERLTLKGTEPPNLSAAICTTGFLFPPLYSIRIKRASSLAVNQPEPYSSMYKSPLASNSMSIGLLNL